MRLWDNCQRSLPQHREALHPPPKNLQLRSAVPGIRYRLHESGQVRGGQPTGGRRPSKGGVDGVNGLGIDSDSAIAAEDRAVRFLARRIAENASEPQAATAEISAVLESDETYRCLLTIPGIGPKTTSELTISIDIDDFPSHDTGQGQPTRQR